MHYLILINRRHVENGKPAMRSVILQYFSWVRDLKCWEKVGSVPLRLGFKIPEEYKVYLQKEDKSIINLDVVVEY